MRRKVDAIRERGRTQARGGRRGGEDEVAASSQVFCYPDLFSTRPWRSAVVPPSVTSTSSRAAPIPLLVGLQGCLEDGVPPIDQIQPSWPHRHIGLRSPVLDDPALRTANDHDRQGDLRLAGTGGRWSGCGFRLAGLWTARNPVGGKAGFRRRISHQLACNDGGLRPRQGGR